MSAVVTRLVCSRCGNEHSVPEDDFIARCEQDGFPVIYSLPNDHPRRCHLRDQLAQNTWRCHKLAGHSGACSCHTDCGEMNNEQERIYCGGVMGHTGPHGWEPAPETVPTPELPIRGALVRVLRDVIPFLEQWKIHDQARESRQWLALRESMQAARTVLTGDDSIGLMGGDMWAMESRTNTGFAVEVAAPAPLSSTGAARLEALVLEYTADGECSGCGAEVCRSAEHYPDCVIGQVDAALRGAAPAPPPPPPPPPPQRVELSPEYQELFAAEEALSEAYLRLRRKLAPFGAFDTPQAPTGGGPQVWATTELALDKALGASAPTPELDTGALALLEESRQKYWDLPTGLPRNLVRRLGDALEKLLWRGVGSPRR